MIKQEVIEKIKEGTPFEGLGDVRLVETLLEPQVTYLPDKNIRPDMALRLDFGGSLFTVYGEVKTQVTPKLLRELGPWLARLKALNQKEPYALICPFLSPESQRYCQENNIDFIDLCGNVLISVPGNILIQRLGRPNMFKEPQIFRNPFGGASSRVIRVLLQSPSRIWTVTEVYKELKLESQRQNKRKGFQPNISSISKTIQSLGEELLIRRDKLKIIVPEPRQLLLRWAEKYRERFKWMRRSSWTGKNPFGFDVESSINGLKSRFSNLDFLITGTSAANLIAPFANIDRIDVFLLKNQYDEALRSLNNERSVGPDFLFIYPYDIGVSMYARQVKGLTIASDIQIYLDCYARGGRDLKQAYYLLSNIIEKQWNKT